MNHVDLIHGSKEDDDEDDDEWHTGWW